MNVQPGDWIRFYQGGKLVIGVVGYVVPRASWESHDKAATDIGEVPLNLVREVRSAAPQERDK